MESALPRRTREHWLFLACALAAPLVLLVLGRLLHPDPRGWGTHEQLGFRPCFPMVRWNLPCPGCGVTTAIALAAHGDLLASLRAQPFGLVALAAAFAAAAWALAGHARGRDLYSAFLGLRCARPAAALGTAALLAWLYKLAAVRGWLGL